MTPQRCTPSTRAVECHFDAPLSIRASHRCQLRRPPYGCRPVGRKGYNHVYFLVESRETLWEQEMTRQWLSTYPQVPRTQRRQPARVLYGSDGNSDDLHRDAVEHQVPDNGSMAVWSARMLLFTPARSAATRTAQAGLPVAPPVRQAHHARPDRIGHLHRWRRPCPRLAGDREPLPRR